MTYRSLALLASIVAAAIGCGTPSDTDAGIDAVTQSDADVTATDATADPDVMLVNDCPVLSAPPRTNRPVGAHKGMPMAESTTRLPSSPRTREAPGFPLVPEAHSAFAEEL